MKKPQSINTAAFSFKTFLLKLSSWVVCITVHSFPVNSSLSINLSDSSALPSGSSIPFRSRHFMLLLLSDFLSVTNLLQSDMFRPEDASEVFALPDGTYLIVEG